MSYPGNGEVSGVFRPLSEVEVLNIRTTKARFIAPGSFTGGRYGLFHWDMPADAGGSGPHFHRTFSEAFFVLSGTVGLYDGDKWTDGKPGDFFYIPEGGIHAFRNDSGEVASMLILFAPGAPRERYFEELAEIAATGRKPSDDEWTELFARHDQYMV